jgi:hypothetical protein
MIQNNIAKIRSHGFIGDSLLLEETDTRYCQAIFCIPTSDNLFLNSNFYTLLQKLSADSRGITFCPCNKFSEYGTFHHTFMQQVSFNTYTEWSSEISEQHYQILSEIMKPHFPFRINYRKLIAVPSGLTLCGYPSLDMNQLRSQYRSKCQEMGLLLQEPYFMDIVHSTLFRFTINVPDSAQVFKDYKEYLNRTIDYGYIVVDHYWMGKGTWKINSHEIKTTHKIT